MFIFPVEPAGSGLRVEDAGWGEGEPIGAAVPGAKSGVVADDTGHPGNGLGGDSGREWAGHGAIRYAGKVQFVAGLGLPVQE